MAAQAARARVYAPARAHAQERGDLMNTLTGFRIALFVTVLAAISPSDQLARTTQGSVCAPPHWTMDTTTRIRLGWSLRLKSTSEFYEPGRNSRSCGVKSPSAPNVVSYPR